MALGLGGLFLHGKNLAVLVNLHHAALHKFLFIRLKVAHDAGCSLIFGVSHKFCQREVQHIITGDDQHIVIKPQLFNGILHIAYSTQTGVIAAGSIINDNNILRLLCCPFFKVMGKLVVADDHIGVHQSSRVDVVNQPVQNGFLPHLQQRLRKIFSQRIQPGCIARCQNQTFHISITSVPHHPRSRTDGSCTCLSFPGKLSGTSAPPLPEWHLPCQGQSAPCNIP